MGLYKVIPQLGLAVEVARTQRTKSGSRLLHEMAGQPRGYHGLTGRGWGSRSHLWRGRSRDGGVHAAVGVGPPVSP